MLSDGWLLIYELLKNLHIKLNRSAMRKQTTEVTTIALLVLCTGELKNTKKHWWKNTEKISRECYTTKDDSPPQRVVDLVTTQSGQTNRLPEHRDQLPLSLVILMFMIFSWNELQHDKTKNKWVCAQWRLRSAWASAQSDQSLRCPHEESLGP